MSSNPPVLGLLRRVYLSGGIVEIVDGGMLGLTGQPCPEHLKADLKEHKAAVLDTLKEQRIGERDDGFNSLVPRRYVVPDACLANRACARLGMCSEALRNLPCDHSPQEATS